MARGNDVSGALMFCELEGCEGEGLRVDGSPVYRFLCLPHAEAMGLEVREGFEPLPAPTRTLPLAIFDAIGDAGEVRVMTLDHAIIALEDALAADEPLERVRGLLRAMREARGATAAELAPIVAPGF
jgi:hypothetical protein